MILDILALIVGTLSIAHRLISDAGPRKKRKLTFGFCDIHRRKRTVRKCLGLFAIPLGLGMFIAGVGLNLDPHTWLAGFTAVGAILGITLFATGIFIVLYLPGPRCVKEGPGHLWIAGAGKALVEAQKPLPPGGP